MTPFGLGPRFGLVALLACSASCNVYTSELLLDAEGGTSFGGRAARGGGTTQGGEAAGGLAAGGTRPGGAAGASGGGVDTAGGSSVGGLGGGSPPETGGGSGGHEGDIGGTAGEGGESFGGESGAGGSAGDDGSAGAGGISGAGGAGGAAGGGGAPPMAGSGGVITGGGTGQGGSAGTPSGGVSSGGTPTTGGAPTGGRPPTPTCPREFPCTETGGPADDLVIATFDGATPLQIEGPPRYGYWYVYGSAGGTQTPTAATIGELFQAPGADGTAAAAMTWGSGFAPVGGYAGLGVNFNDPGLGHLCPYDGSMYAGVRFRIKGTASNSTVRFKVLLSDALPVASGGTCCLGTQCEDHFRMDFPVTSDWQTQTVLWEQLETDPFWGNEVVRNPATLMGLQWQVTGPAAYAAFEIWLDSVEFLPGA
jgi:hypothetical protein